MLSRTDRQLLGLDGSALRAFGEHWLLPETANAFALLARAAGAAGFDLRIASAHRSFERQLHIWNAKLRGERPVVDDDNQPVDLSALSGEAQLACVLRFSAMPGASRHHWGTDIDVYDAAALPPDQRLRLDATEVADDGPFGPLHQWLDEQIAEGRSFGFYRPYDCDRGGVAPERWHLSFAPLAEARAMAVTPAKLRAAWAFADAEGMDGGVLGRAVLDEAADALVERYVARFAAPPKTALP